MAPRHRPPQRVSPGATRVLCALLHVYARDRWASVRSVTEASGSRSCSTVHGYLRELQDAGLADWEPGLAGTLRPTAYPVRLSA